MSQTFKCTVSDQVYQEANCADPQFCFVLMSTIAGMCVRINLHFLSTICLCVKFVLSSRHCLLIRKQHFD